MSIINSIHAELDWATELRSLAEPKALDYTEVYAESFAGRVHIPDAKHERSACSGSVSGDP